MSDKLKKAIEVLKKFKEWANTPINGSSKYDLIKLFGSIDTVVAEVEKPLPTDDEIIERANEAYPGEEIVPHFQRVGFTFGAKWIRNLMRKETTDE